MVLGTNSSASFTSYSSASLASSAPSCTSCPTRLSPTCLSATFSSSGTARHSLPSSSPGRSLGRRSHHSSSFSAAASSLARHLWSSRHFCSPHPTRTTPVQLIQQLMSAFISKCSIPAMALTKVWRTLRRKYTLEKKLFT